MSDHNSLEKLFSKSINVCNDNIFTIGTTVDTGFEWEAIDECKEKLGKDVEVVKQRGRIYFNIDWDQFAKIQQMRSIDNIFIVVDIGRLSFTNDKEIDLKSIYNYIVSSLDKRWRKTLDAWKCATRFMGKLYPTIEEYIAAKEQILVTKTEELEIHNEEKGEHEPSECDISQKKELENKGKKRGQDPSESKKSDILRYRVTCERNGKHAFESKDIARITGEVVQDKYHWIVDLTKYHLEVVCKLIDDLLITHLRVTHESKHRRNIASFGPTTLRSTICYNLLRLANPKPGDIIIDPMCGGGSIPIEATLAYPYSYVLCGDNDSRAVDRTKSNMNASTAGCKIDLVQWTATKLPFKDSFIDIIVTDMPFGKRSGNKSYNKTLYKHFLLELGRIVKLSYGRLVLLTYDRYSFKEALQAAGDLFWVTKTVGVNVGGLQAVVYVLNRTHIFHDRFKPRIVKQYNHPRDNKNSILGFTPLSFASQQGHLDRVNTLIANGADLSTKTDKLNTPLHLAAENGHLDIVNVFIKKGLDVNAVNNDRARPLHFAVQNGNLEVVKALISHGSDINAGSSGIGNHRVDTNITPLHLGTQTGRLDIVKALLEAGANVNARTGDKITPLHLASQNGFLELVNILLKAKSNVDAKDYENLTSLHLAAERNHLGVVKSLLVKGIDVHAKDCHNSTALHTGSQNGHLEVVKLLIEKKANVNAKKDEGFTPLHLAIQQSHFEVSDFLIKNGANINAVDDQNWTPLHNAAYNGFSLKIVESLIAKGANINAKIHDGRRALHLAAEHNHLEIVNFLIEKGADVNAVDNRNWTPLHFAAYDGNLEVAKSLLDKGVDINAKTVKSTTPLQFAVDHDHLEVVELLLKKGADVNALDHIGSLLYILQQKKVMIRLPLFC